MNLQSLSYFITIAEKGSITGAAQGLYISAQGLNKMVTSMEEEVGYRLLERTKRGVTLTESGETFLRHAKKLVKGYNALLDELAMENRDHQIMMECPYKIAATALCLERIVQPLVSLGFMGNVELHGTILDHALELSDKDGWLALIDIPTYVSPRPTSLAGSKLIPLATSKMGITYRKSRFPDLPVNPTADEVAHLPLGVIDAPTMCAYAKQVLGPATLAEQTRYFTRQYGLLEDAIVGGKAVVFFDSLSFSQSKLAKMEGIVFAQIEDHICELGFIHNDNARDENKRAYVDAFRRVFLNVAARNSWSVA